MDMPKKKREPSQKLAHREAFSAKMETANKHAARVLTQHYAHNHAVDLGRQAKDETLTEILLQDDGIEDFEMRVQRSYDYISDEDNDDYIVVAPFVYVQLGSCPDNGLTRWACLERERIKHGFRLLKQHRKFKVGAWGTPSPVRRPHVSITHLEPYLLTQIRTHLNTRDSAAFACVCKLFHSTAPRVLLPSLPDELLIHIAAYLDPVDAQLSFSRVCRSLHRWCLKRPWHTFHDNYETPFSWEVNEHPMTSIMRNAMFVRQLGRFGRMPANYEQNNFDFYPFDWHRGSMMYDSVAGVVDFSRKWYPIAKVMFGQFAHKIRQLFCPSCGVKTSGWIAVQLHVDCSPVDVCTKGHFWRGTLSLEDDA